MSDFAAYKEWAIPEGKVKQVADEAGNVLWKAAKKMTITLTGAAITCAEYNGTKYNAPAIFEAAVGDEIYLETTAAPRGGSIYLNGTQVASGSGSANYTYTVNCNAVIETKASGSGSSASVSAYITEIPEGQILFTVNGTNYFADEGMTWAEWFASDYNTTGKTAADVQSISANGVAVELSAVIVGGSAYEVGFDNGMRKITVIREYDGGSKAIVYVGEWPNEVRYMDDGNCDYFGTWTTWTSPTTIEMLVGAPISFSTEDEGSKTEVILNGTVVLSEAGDYVSWWNEYTVTKNVTVTMKKETTHGVATYTLIITEE